MVSRSEPSQESLATVPDLGLSDDLQVECIDDSLQGVSCDVIITGSIAAVESVRTLRALRRLGARVFAHLTPGAERFITPLSVAWASAGDPPTTLASGRAEHLAQRDVCLVLPASANFLSKAANGICDNHALTLVQSYLGAGKPIMFLPCMHKTLADSPLVQQNLAKLLQLDRVYSLSPRKEEGKSKMPDPLAVADSVSHHWWQSRYQLHRQGPASRPGMIVAYGGTQAAIDPVRCLSNISTGSLGEEIVRQAYRRGYEVHAVKGVTTTGAKVPSASLAECLTNKSMEIKLQNLLATYPYGLVMAAALQDFLPEHESANKIASTSRESLTLNLKRTHKVLSGLKPQVPIKVGFKLESILTEDHLRELQTKMPELGLSLLVANEVNTVSSLQKHEAIFLSPDSGDKQAGWKIGKSIVSKKAIAAEIFGHFEQYYNPGKI